MKSNFQKKIFINISVMIVILVTIFLLFFSNYVYKEITRSSRNSLDEITEKTSRELLLLFQDMDKLSLYLTTNPEIMSAFYKTRIDTLSNNELSAEINSILTFVTVPNDSSRFRISLYNKKGNFISTGIPYSKTIATQKLHSTDYITWYQSLPIKHSNSYITSFKEDTWSDKPIEYISLYREIFDPIVINLSNGIIEVQCPYPIIDNVLSLEASTISSYLFDDSSKCIYSSSNTKPLMTDLLPNYQENTSKHSPFNIIHNNDNYSGIPLDNGWTLVLSQHQNHIFKLVAQIFWIVFGISLGILLIFLFIIFKILKNTTEPLRQLTDSVTAITIQDPYLNIDTSEYPNEFVGLTLAFDKMLERLKNSMDENVKIREYEVRANMIALQSQMNPHFICNLLTIIKAISMEENPEQIGIICDYLAGMLQYISTYDEHGVTLQDELTDAENYLKLMKIRYEDLFHYDIYVDSNIDLNKLMVPKLLFQPLLENCFQHGFKKTLPPWHISIECHLEKEYLWKFIIQDNGIGITPEQIHKFKTKLADFENNSSDSVASFKIGGMGLINTLARLKLRYKENFSFTIDSLPDGGTIICIGGKLNVEYFIG